MDRDPRILRQVQALKQDYKITAIGYTQISDDSVMYYPVKMNRPTKRTLNQKLRLLFSTIFTRNNYIKESLENYLDLNNVLSQNIVAPNVIIANDWEGLYLASLLKQRNNWYVKIYFDAHEYAPLQHSASLRWRLAEKPIAIYALKKCRTDIAVMSTVCDGIAREYEKFFDFPAGFVKVITNAAEYNAALKPVEVGGKIIRLIHHGGAMKQRKLELMMEMMQYLDPDKYELTFMLVNSDPDYFNYLLEISKKSKNIKFIEPVPFSEIPAVLNSYDVGVYLILPEHFNHKHCLPNKLFEYVQARLAIAIGPSIEMVKIVNKYDLGVCSKDFTPKSLANTIAQLTVENIMKYKKNADKYAKELSAEENLVKIKNIITGIE